MPNGHDGAARRGIRYLLSMNLGPWFALAAMLVTAALLGALFVVGLEPVNPVQSSRLASVDPPERVIDRDRRPDFTMEREICSSRDEQVQVLRSWTEITSGQEVRPTIAWSSSFFDVAAGCQRVVVTQGVPMALPPGQYVYEISLRACGLFGFCVEYALEPIPLALVGGRGWPKLDIGPPPALDGLRRTARSRRAPAATSPL